MVHENNDKTKIDENTHFKLDYETVVDLNTIMMEIRDVVHHTNHDVSLKKEDIIKTNDLLKKFNSSAKFKKRNRTVCTAAASVRKRRRTKSVDEIDKEPIAKSGTKLFKVESNRFLKENLAVTTYRVDPFFEDDTPVPFISSSVQSKLAIRAVILNDATLLQNLIDDVDHVCSVHIKRDFPESLTAIHYAIQRNNIDLLLILLKDLKEPKGNRCDFPVINMEEHSTASINSIDLRTTKTNPRSRVREGNRALLKDAGDVLYSDHEETLVYAMKNNCSRQVYDLLSENQKYKGYSNIFECVRAGHRKLAASIINEIQQSNRYGFNKLHYQVLEFDDEDLVIRCARHVIRKARGNFQLTPIHCAAINPNPKYLKQLLAVVPRFNITDEFRRRPIHFAAACAGSEPLNYLLSKHVNFNEVDTDGNAPLHIAVQHGRAKNVELLLNKAREKAESNDTDDQVMYEKFGLASINRMNKSRLCPLHIAALNNHLDCVQMLVAYDAHVDAFTSLSSGKVSPLMLACQHGFLDIAICLIGHGARVEARDRFKRTPLIHACMYGQAHIVSYLLRRGASANVCDSSMNTALHYATAFGWYFCVTLLIEAGANPNCSNDSQMTCLAVAFSKGHDGICDFLLSECRANINVKNREGLTLLMFILNLKMTLKTVEQSEQVAVKYKADCTLVDNHGRNAFHHLALKCLDEDDQNDCKSYFFQIAQMLLNQRCNPIQMDNKAQTPLINALQSKNYIMVEFLIHHAHIELISDVCYDGKTLLHYFAMNCENYRLTQILINVSATDQLKIMAKMRDAEGRTSFDYCMQQFDNFCRTNRDSDEITKNQYHSIVNMIQYLLEIIECDPDLETQPPNIFHLLRTVSFIDQMDEHPLAIFLKRTKAINVLHHQTRRTALLEAIYLKEEKIIELLLHHPSCDINLATLDSQKTPLILACQLQFLPLIRSLLINASCDPLVYDEERNQALHYYLATSQRSEEYLEIFRLFIEKLESSDKNALNSQGKSNRTPLHIAVYHNLGTFRDTHCVEQTLIDHECNLFIQDDAGNLPLHDVFLNRRVKDDPVQLCAVIIKGMNYHFLDTKNNEGNTPLHLAVVKASTICTMLLLRHQANLLIENNLSTSAISTCVASNHMNLFISFLQQPIDIDLSTLCSQSDGPTGSTHSSELEKKHLWTWKYAVQSKITSKKQYPLIYFIIHFNWQGVLPIILDELSRFHLKYIDIFMSAVLNNRRELVLHLLTTVKNRTVLHEKNSDEQNLFHVLANFDHDQHFLENCLNFLNDQQVEWNVADKYGSYPLHYACARHNIYFIEFLRKKYLNQVNFDQMDSFNCTASGLLFCSLAKNKSFNKEYLQNLMTSNKALDCLCYGVNEASVNPLSFGRVNSLVDYVTPYPPDNTEPVGTLMRISPLINAIVHDNFVLAKLLLDLGVDANFPDEQQRTPLMHAVRLNNIRMVKLLVDSNTFRTESTINLDAADGFGSTCIHYLVQPFSHGSYTNNIELLELLYRLGASLTKLDQNGHSPLDYTINNVCQILYEKLLELINGKKTDSTQSVIKRFSIDDPNKSLLGLPNYYSDAQRLIDEYVLKHASKTSSDLFTVDPLSNMSKTGKVVIDTERNKPYDIRLTITDVDCGPIGLYNFYRMQIIKHKSKIKLYLLFTRWGRIGGGDGEHQLKSFSSLDECRTEFCKIFYEKTGNQWENMEQFETQPKHYTLIQLSERQHQKHINVPIDFQRLQDENQHLPSKLQSSAYKSFFKTFLNPKAIETTLQKSQLDIEWMPVSQLKPSMLQKAREILLQLKDEIQSKEQLRLTIQQAACIEQTETYNADIQMNKSRLKIVLDTIFKLTNEYYSIVPLEGYGNERLPMIDTGMAVKAQEQKLDDILELELSYKMLLAVQANLNQISPFDYLYKSIHRQFEAIDRDDMDSQLILRYIWTSAPSIKVEQILKVAQLNDDERSSQRNLENHYLLWHGTSVCNLISILTRGLLVRPLYAKATGTRFGKGIYTADAFAKSLEYCSGVEENGNARYFMLLCQVALGNSQEVEEEQTNLNEPLDLHQYQSRKAHGQQIPDPRHTITRNYGVQMPLGQLINCQDPRHTHHHRTYNEYVIFDESQIAIRYIVQFEK